MSSIRHAGVLQALTALEVDYWYDVDRNWGRTAHTFYVEDGVFAIGDKVMAGRQAVIDFYRWREGRGARTARHVVSNFRLSDRRGDTAEFECIMCLYAADGLPVRESRPAIMIADVQSVCKLADNTWRYTSHRLLPVFMGGEAPTLPPE